MHLDMGMVTGVLTLASRVAELEERKVLLVQTQQKELAAMREKLLQLAAVVDSVKGTQLAAALEQEFSDGVGEGRGRLPAARKENAMEKMRRGAQEAVQPR